MANGTYTYTTPGVYTATLTVMNACGSDTISTTVNVTPAGFNFLRGDSNGDGSLASLVDALHLLNFGFNGGPAPICLEAADVNGDGVLAALIDALFLLNFGFNGGAAPGAPFPACGADPAPATSLGCAANGCP